ncbi:hypothetical protein Droror1_Dr00008595 [Drosera rotundifolia]
MKVEGTGKGVLSFSLMELGRIHGVASWAGQVTVWAKLNWMRENLGEFESVWAGSKAPNLSSSTLRRAALNHHRCGLKLLLSSFPPLLLRRHHHCRRALNHHHRHHRRAALNR